MADYRRQKSSISKREWKSKTKKQNINYIKRKLKEYNLDIPKYLVRGELSDRQINSISNRIIRAIEKKIDVQRQENDSFNKLYNNLHKAEMQYKKSFKNASPLERDVFLGNKTVQFLDKDNVSSPLYFHNFKNISQFKKLLSAIDKNDREQYINDYVNQLKVNNYSEVSNRLTKSFTKKLKGFYDVGSLNKREIKNHNHLENFFNSLDYVRQMDMINIMDDAEYQQMVESLVKRGYSEPLAIEIALQNLGFRADSDYSIIE